MLARKRIKLVYGAGSVGLMGVIADAVLGGGGHVLGVIPEFLATKELLHPTLSETVTVHDMHARKAFMAGNSDAFAILPGGLGTFEEAFEVLTWAQLSLHKKPIGFLNTGGYFDGLLQFLQNAVELGFIREQHFNLFEVATAPEELLAKLEEKLVFNANGSKLDLT